MKQDIYPTYDVETRKESVKQLITFDCDDPKLTLMKCIKKIWKYTDNIANDEVVTLYFVSANSHTHTNMNWRFLWNFLISTDRSYILAFRGYFEPANYDVFKIDKFEVFISSDSTMHGIKLTDELNKHNLKYNLI